MVKSIFSSLKQRLYSRYNHRIDNPVDRKRSEFFAEWIDVGFARHRWTNDGEIAPEVFRANNPDEKRFKAYASQGIRTVVNLRNDVERSPARLAEERVKQNGMVYVSYPMFPRVAPSKQELLGLVDLFQSLEKPILFHCKSGADRTGLVAAIWLLVQEGEPLSTARTELSLKYIHRRDSETGVLDEILDGFAPFEGKLSFQEWVAEHYDPKVAEQNAERAKPKRNFWGKVKYFSKDVYEYAQHREGRWHRSFEKEIKTEEDRKRAHFFMTWIDHAILRRFWHNHHEIGPSVYRSNHPTEDRFRKYADDGLKTVVNLRGASMAPQYQLEKVLCSELDLELIDITTSGAVAPSRDSLLKLLDVFDSATRPMLMHCKSGADRTGLASALYKVTIGESVQSALSEFSLRYVHIRNGSKGLLQWILLQYEVEGQNHQIPLRNWIESHYNPEIITHSFHALRGHWSFPAEVQMDASGNRTESVASVVYVNRDTPNLDKWIERQGDQHGMSSVFVILDGYDLSAPKLTGITLLRTPKSQGSLAAQDRLRAKRLANLTEVLSRTFDRVEIADSEDFVKWRSTKPVAGHPSH